MPSVSAPPYPVVAGASASQAVYPTAPSAPPASPGGEAPPSYEESVHGAGKVEDAEVSFKLEILSKMLTENLQAFAPRYPVYNNLPQQQNSQLPPEYAPPLPAKSGF